MKKETSAAMLFLSKRDPLPKWSKQQYLEALDEFLLHKGDKALCALAGFYLYIVGKFANPDKEASALSEVFSHDLHKASDKFMLPRSSNYLKYWEEEFNKSKITEVSI